jgi:hypothetical protein
MSVAMDRATCLIQHRVIVWHCRPGPIQEQVPWTVPTTDETWPRIAVHPGGHDCLALKSGYLIMVKAGLLSLIHS